MSTILYQRMNRTAVCMHSITPSTYGYIRWRTRGVLGILPSIELTSGYGRLWRSSYPSVYRLFRHLDKQGLPLLPTANRGPRVVAWRSSKPLSAASRPVSFYDRWNTSWGSREERSTSQWTGQITLEHLSGACISISSIANGFDILFT